VEAPEVRVGISTCSVDAIRVSKDCLASSDYPVVIFCSQVECDDCRDASMAMKVYRDVGLFKLSIVTRSDYIFDFPLWNPALLGLFQGIIEVPSEILQANFVPEFICINEERLGLILGRLGVICFLS
jgi:hypothetical protein